jgi:hypothetical protein
VPNLMLHVWSKYLAIQGSSFDIHDMKLSLLRRAAESALTEIVGILLAHPEYATLWDPNMDFVLEAAIYRRDSTAIQQFHGVLSPGVRDTVLRGPDNHGFIDVDQGSSNSQSLYSLRVYHRNRDQRGRSLLHMLRLVYNHYLGARCRALETKPDARLLNPQVTGQACLHLPRASHEFPQELRPRGTFDSLPMYPVFIAAMDRIAQILGILERSVPRLQVQVQIPPAAREYEFYEPVEFAVWASRLWTIGISWNSRHSCAACGRLISQTRLD